jgi:hypothetical protein
MFESSDRDFLFMVCVIALIGWAAIEVLIWIFQHLTLSWR